MKKVLFVLFTAFIPLIAVPQSCSVQIQTFSTVTCNGYCDGIISAIATGVPPFNYVWTNHVSTDSAASALCAGTYSVTVSDNNGCSSTSTFVLTEPKLLFASATTTDVTCHGGSNGSIVTTVTGGTLPYAYF